MSSILETSLKWKQTNGLVMDDGCGRMGAPFAARANDRSATEAGRVINQSLSRPDEILHVASF
jgi:hypothetical protein